MAEPELITVVGNGQENQVTGPIKAGQLELSATYLDDALSHRHIPFTPSEDGARMYNTYKHPIFTYLLFMFFAIDVSLAFFEAPAVEGWALPYWATLAIELLCIAYFIGRLMHELMLCSSAKVFWKDTKHVTFAVILGLTILDITIYTIMRETGHHPENAVRWSRPLRPFLIVNFPEARQIRRAFRNIRRTLPDLANVLILFLASVALFSLMAVKLFKHKNLQEVNGSNKSYFTDFFDAYWDLFVLVTTANSPDIMMPAYDANKGYAIFFVAYLVVNLYLFMRVFLAVVYNSYKDNLKSEVREAVQQKRTLLRESFDLAKNSDSQVMTKEAFFQLMKKVMAKKKQEYWEVLWLILDEKESGVIDLQQFSNVVDLVHMRVVNVKDKRTLFEKWLPTIYTSRPSKILIKCVRHVYFRYLFDAIIFVNAVFIAFDLDEGEPFFLTLFTLEIVLKLYAFGVQAFFRKLWNIFDVLVVGSALIITLVEAAKHESHASDVTLDFLMVLRVIRIFKIFHTINRFRVVINTILHILPSMATYGGVLLVFYYFFAIIGMEIFQGKISFHGYDEDGQSVADKFCGNSRLKESEFYRDHYCRNNFNDLVSSMVTLFELMVVNQWHVLTEGHVLVTSRVARIFFFVFHFLCVIVVLNIFSAFVIEAFILEFSLTSKGRRPQSPLTHRINAMGLGYGSKPLKQTTVESNRPGDEEQLVPPEDDEEEHLDADHNRLQLTANGDGSSSNQIIQVKNMTGVTFLRFHLASRTRTVMGLLEKMFESELKEEMEFDSP